MQEHDVCESLLQRISLKVEPPTYLGINCHQITEEMIHYIDDEEEDPPHLAFDLGTVPREQIAFPQVPEHWQLRIES